MDKYKIVKNKQIFIRKVLNKSVCEKYKGKTQIANSIKLKNGFLLKRKSLNNSLKNKIFNIASEGASKNGKRTANRKRSEININADKDRNFRSSNKIHTSNEYACEFITQNVTISDCFSFCKLSTDNIILSVNSCISSLQS